MKLVTRTLSVADRLEIHELIARYNVTEDIGKIEDWVSTFTTDGSFTGRTGKSWVGHDVLTRFALERWERPGVRQYLHWINNVMIIPTDEGAQSRCYVMLVEQLSHGYCIKGLAAKTDELRQEDGQWRFLNRRSAPWPIWDLGLIGQGGILSTEQATGTLSVADRLEIHELLARFNYAEDTGEVEPWVSTFTTDGRFTIQNGKSWAGSEELTRFALERRERPDLGRYLHWTNNIILTPTDEGAQARSHIMLVEKTPDGFGVRSMSAKTDELRRQGGQWRFQSRQVLPWPTWEQGRSSRRHTRHGVGPGVEQVTKTLSATDQLEIHELIARYFFTLDLGEVEAWVSLFTTDGSLTTPAGKSWVGSDELSRFALERWKRPEVRQRLHGFNNVIITPTNRGAQSRCYCMQLERMPDGCHVFAMSAITDDLQQEQGQWRIRTRQIVHWPSA